MQDSTSITYERVRSDANTIKDCSVEMRGIFDNFEGTMKTVGAPENFLGEGNDSLQEKFAKLRTKFDDYVQLVEEFSNMILTASEMTEQTERNIANDADTLAS